MKKIVIFIGFLILIINGVAQANLNDGLVVHYEFEGNLLDTSGNNYHGIELIGVDDSLSYGNGVLGQALHFPGPNSGATFWSNFRDNKYNWGEKTFSYWVKPGSEGDSGGISSFEPLINLWKVEGDSWGTTDQDFRVGVNAYRPYIGSFGRTGSPSGDNCLYNTLHVYGETIDQNQWKEQWTHIVATFDSNGQGKLFINGELTASTQTLYSDHGGDWSDPNILRDPPEFPYIFNMKEVDVRLEFHNHTETFVDDFRIYNRSLSESEIQSLYNQGNDLNRGLVAYYPLNGNSNDESGNNNDGIEFGGVAYPQGVRGQAASFDGIDDYISADGSGELALSDWTISTWIRPKSFPQADSIHFLGKREDSNLKYNYALILTSDGQVRSQYEAINSSDFDHTIGGGYYGASPVQLNEWTHITSTRNSSTGEHKLYINGKLIAKNQWFYSPITNDEELRFGVSYGPSAFTNGWLYNGDLDEVRIYNRALSDTEVQKLYMGVVSADVNDNNWITQNVSESTNGTLTMIAIRNRTEYAYKKMNWDGLSDIKVSVDVRTTTGFSYAEYIRFGIFPEGFEQSTDWQGEPRCYLHWGYADGQSGMKAKATVEGHSNAGMNPPTNEWYTYTLDYDYGNKNMVIAFTNSAGNVVWQKTYPNFQFNFSTSNRLIGFFSGGMDTDYGNPSETIEFKNLKVDLGNEPGNTPIAEVGDFYVYDTAELPVDAVPEDIDFTAGIISDVLMGIISKKISITPPITEVISATTKFLQQIDFLPTFALTGVDMELDGESYVVPVIFVETGASLLTDYGNIKLFMYSKPYPWEREADFEKEIFETIRESFSFLKPRHVYAFILKPFTKFDNFSCDDNPSNSLGFGVLKKMEGYYGFELDLEYLKDMAVVNYYCGHHYLDNEGDNNEEAALIPLNFNEKERIEASINPKNDVDVFKLDISEWSKIEVDVHCTFSKSFKLNAVLKDGKGNVVASGDSLEYDALKPGEYFVEVQSVPSWVTGDYRLGVEIEKSDVGQTFDSGFKMKDDSYSFGNDEDFRELAHDTQLDQLKAELVSFQLIFPDKASKAIAGWLFEYYMVNNGSCFGFTESAQYYKLFPDEKPLEKKIFDYTQEEGVEAIANFQVGQSFPLLWDLINIFDSDVSDANDSKEEYDTIKANIKKGSPVVVRIYYEYWDFKDSKYKNAGHALLAYKVEETVDDGTVYVYDPNKAKDESQKIVFTKIDEDTYKAEYGSNTLKEISAWSPLFSSTAAIHDIKKQISTKLPSLISTFTSSLYEKGKTIFHLACPVDALLTDQYGRRIGMLNGEVINEIPDAEVVSTGEVEIYEVPSNLTYHVTIVGIGFGTAELSITSPIPGENQIANVTFNEIPVSDTMRVTFNFSGADTENLQIDQDGDGTFESTQAPSTQGVINIDLSDSDEDGIIDILDNCPNTYNPDQEDSDGDGVGDVCQLILGDLNNDRIVDINDINVIKANLKQPSEFFPEADIDGDGVITVLDARKLMLMCDCPRCVCPD